MAETKRKEKKEKKPHNSKEYIKKSIKKLLDEKRYKHTLGVAATCVSLAMRYEEDLGRAELAGLLHDCAKYGTDDWKEAQCAEYGIALSEAEHQNKALIHAKLGAYFASTRYEITDPEILSAITKHTTGSPAMTTLEKIVYVSDYIEPGRKMLDHLPLIRKTAFLDIDEAIYMIAGDTLGYLQKKGGVIDEMTEETYNYYKQLHEEKGE